MDEFKASQAKSLEDLEGLRKNEMDELKAELASLVRGRSADDQRPVEAWFGPRLDELGKGIIEIANKTKQK